MSDEYVCKACGYRVPADQTGVALMLEHLREHDRESA